MPVERREYIRRDGSRWLGFRIEVVAKAPDGREHRIRRKALASTLAAAKKEEQAIRAHILAGKYEAPSDTPSTFKEAAEAFLADSVHRKASTTRRYADTFKLHLYPAFGALALPDITRARVLKFTTEHSKGREVSTVNSNLTALRAVLMWSWREGLLAERPQVRLVKRTTPQSERFLTAEEIAATINAAKAEKHPEFWVGLVTTLARTGIRIGEALALTWNDVALERRRLTVRASYYSGQTTVPKTGKVRTIPLTTGAVEALKALPRFETTPLVFTTDGNQTTRHMVAQPLRRIGERAGIKGLRAHLYRHSFASHCVESGMSLVAVAALTGHASVVQLNRYAHARSDETDLSFLDG